jgi:hypothetical protein
MVSRGGVILTAVIGGATALLTLLVVKLWPKNSDALERASARVLRRWHRFVGLDQ